MKFTKFIHGYYYSYARFNTNQLELRIKSLLFLWVRQIPLNVIMGIMSMGLNFILNFMVAIKKQ